MIAKRTKRNPEFPGAPGRRAAAPRAAPCARRAARGAERSQTAVAAAMATSQSAVARLESTASDAKMSTVDRYAASLGYVIQYHLVPAESGAETPPVVVH